MSDEQSPFNADGSLRRKIVVESFNLTEGRYDKRVRRRTPRGRKCPKCGHKVKEHYKKSSIFGNKVICDGDDGECGCKTRYKEFFSMVDKAEFTRTLKKETGLDFNL